MGFAPPPDSPPPQDQASAAGDITFGPSPTGTQLCGFGIPKLSYNVSFHLPKFPPFPFPPVFNFFIGFNCDLSNPIAAPFGGGRKTTIDPDSDPEFGEGISET